LAEHVVSPSTFSGGFSIPVRLFALTAQILQLGIDGALGQLDAGYVGQNRMLS
jgi:hypothetical protein